MKRDFNGRYYLGLAIVLLASFDTAPAQEAAPAQDAAPARGEPRTLRELMDQAVNQVEVYADLQAVAPARPLVALRWANNARGSEDGLTIIYVFEGQPLAAACLYPWDKKLIHDLEALSRSKIVGRYSGGVVWQPQESGARFAPIPDAPEPDATRAARLRQMKSLADQFQSAMLGWKADNTDREELRMLPQPLYRYEPKEKDGAAKGPVVIDGALFAFVMGTDPESLLLIEAVRREGKVIWEYGFARRTSGELEGRHKDKVVWHADRFPQTRDPAKPDFSISQPIPPKLWPAAPQN